MRKTALALLTLLVSHQGLALSTEGVSADEAKARAHKVLANIFRDNADFAKKHSEQCFEPMLKSQHPRATVVMCSDSRVQTYSIDETPDNDLFVIRNIGNQLASNEGSIEYGIRHLATNVLLFLGHTGCGAVKAALGNSDALEPAIRKEVNTIKLSKKNQKEIGDNLWLLGVNENVHAQVAAAQRKFAKEIKEGKLVVVGAVYDLHNRYEQGLGRIAVVNVNGSTKVDDIRKVAPLEGLDFVVPEK